LSNPRTISAITSVVPAACPAPAAFGLFATVALVLSLLSPTATAHHSYTEFDDKQTIEVEGTLTTASWQNPHANLTVRTLDGRTVQVETAGVNYLRRVDAPLELYAIGSSVKVAGWPSKRSSSRMYGTNILSSDGQELVLWRTAPRWRPTAFGTATPAMFGPATPVAAPDAVHAKTLFQVWGSVYGDLDGALKFVTPLSLTEAATKARASFPFDDTAALACKPKGMWIIMAQPFPIDFVDRGDTILLRLEEFDSVRTIHMGGDEIPDTQARTPLGYSIGRWEGEALVVETTHVGGGWVPFGPSARLLERFTPGDDGRLHYTIRITDPDFVTQPAEGQRYWVARPGEQVLPFECKETPR
jgi:uncharacterized protein DUF6152